MESFHTIRKHLNIAARNTYLSYCKILIKYDILDPNDEMINYSEWTTFHESAKNGSYELISLFADKGIDIHHKTKDIWNCLHIAARSGHLTLCKTLIVKHKFDVNDEDIDGFTALHHSAWNGSYELFSFFANKGTDIHLKTKNGENCLHIAASKGHLNLCRTLTNKHNFDANAADNDGFTALHHSARSSIYELVSLFANKGTDIHLKTNCGMNCLHIAAYNGHLNLCKKLIEKHKFDVNAADNDGWTALHNSAINDSYKLVSFFANVGTDIYLKTKYGENCLHIAALNGHLNLCKTLIKKHNFDVNAADNDGWTALHYSAYYDNYELVSLFTNEGIDIHLKTKNGENCLHLAALNGHLNLCKTLIEKHKFDVNSDSNNGWTALHYSANCGSYELVSLFAKEGIDIHMKTKNGESCLHIAALNGHLNLCKTLIKKHDFDINAADNDGWTALHYSARSGCYQLVSLFANKGTDIHLKTNCGMNCLHIAAYNGHLNLCKKLIDKHKFDVNVADNDGWTALHNSAINGSYELFLFLANKGIDIHLKTKNDRNCLYIAALNGHLNLCEKLIEKHKFDVNAVDNEGWTVLHESARSGSYELVSFFANKATDIHLKTNHGSNLLHIAALSDHLNLCKILVDEHKFDVNSDDTDGVTALHHSGYNGNYELISFLADKGADIHVKTKHGCNCLHVAAFSRHLTLCKTLVDKHKLDVNCDDKNGWTPLHYSITHGSYEFVSFFANKCTDIHVKTKKGKNCLHLAALDGHLNLCKALIDKSKFDVNTGDNDGLTALHYSAISGSYELLSFFANMGIDIHLKTSNSSNVLHLSASCGHLNLCKTLINEHNFDVNMVNNKGYTALHYSAENGSFDLFSYILENGSEIYCKTNDMKNVLHISAHEGHIEICKFVLDYFSKDYYDNSTKKHHTLSGKSYRSQVFYRYNTIFLHAMDSDGNTYLHLAAERNHVEVCELLLKYDTEVITLLNRKDEAARDIAKVNGHNEVLNALKLIYDRTGMFSLMFFNFTD